MSTIVLTAISYLLMVCLGYMFKRLGLVKQSDGKAFAQIVLKITLPCAIITSFSTFRMDYSLLVLILFGFLGNVLQVGFGVLYSRGKSRDEKVHYISNAGYNIGNFTLPFTSSFSGPMGVITTSLFDTGNALMLLGFNYLIADNVSNKKKGGFKPLLVIKKLLSSPSFDAYLIMMTVALFEISLPKGIFSITGEIAKANGPMAMFMVGIMMQIDFSKKYLKSAAIVQGFRFAVATLFSIVFSQLRFLPPEVIKSAIIVSWSPIASAAPAYVSMLEGDEAMASFVNAVSILVAIVLIPILAIVL